MVASRRLVEVALVVSLAVAAVVTVTTHSSNPSTLPTGLELASSAQSSALYCTGFSGADGIAPAEVVFTNTTTRPLVVRATILSTHRDRTLTTIQVAPDATARLTSRNFPGRAYYGLEATVNGGGMTASVVGNGLSHAVSPCALVGAATWSLAGLSTHVGTTTVLTMLNPTDTLAVVDVDAITPSGLVTPESFQGVVVGAHAVVSVPLNDEVIDALTVAVHVHAQRGDVVVAAAMTWTGRVVGAATIAAAPGRAAARVFPDLPTNGGSTSTLALANPTAFLETITVDMTLGSSALFPSLADASAIAPFSVTLAGYTESNLTISPATRVPVGGPASVVVSGTGPIVVELVTRAVSGGGPWFSPPVAAGTALTLAGGFTDLGSLLIVNRGASPDDVVLSYLRVHGSPVTVSAVVPAFAVRAIGPAPHRVSYESVVIRARSPVSAAGAVSGRPNGVRIVAGSGGG